MGVSEKAKTFDEIRRIYDALIPKDANLERRHVFTKLARSQKWVRLEDAQQEIKKREKEIDSWIDAYNKINDSYQRERGEQKQKLQQFPCSAMMDYPSYKQKVGDWKKEFEDLISNGS